MKLYAIMKENTEIEDMDTLLLTFNEKQIRETFEKEEKKLKNNENLILTYFELETNKIKQAFGLTDRELKEYQEQYLEVLEDYVLNNGTYIEEKEVCGGKVA